MSTPQLRHDLHDDLRRCRLFADLDDAQIEQLAAVTRVQLLPAEESVFLQGDSATAFYMLGEGQVKVYKLFRDGRTVTLRHVEPGQTFGESALFNPTFPANTETMVESLLYRFPKREFLELLLAHPQLAVNLLGGMARLMVLLTSRVEELSLPVPARLARYLLALADEQLDAAVTGAAPAAPGAAGPDGPRIVRLPTTKRELAARLATVPETLSRTFDRFKRAGVIRMSGGHELIENLSFTQLHRLAQD
jgi:CRP/FNR family transcriptional regulator, dissimilatory nitrate respiration regulator